jgi:two-component system response regulator AtoC
VRQRQEDVPQLISFFLSKYSAAFQRPIPPLSKETRQLFHEHTWPGNLVEIEAAARAIVAVGDETVAMGGLRSMLARAHNGNGKTSLKEAARAASREAEKELILKVLTRTRWNRRRAAQELQISYKALLYKLKQIGYTEYGAT